MKYYLVGILFITCGMLIAGLSVWPEKSVTKEFKTLAILTTENGNIGAVQWFDGQLTTKDLEIWTPPGLKIFQTIVVLGHPVYGSHK